jgi:DUF971 family protein
MDVPEGPSPSEVVLDRERSLTLAWPDGTTATFVLEELRAACPCAECRGLREQGRPVWPKPGRHEPIRAIDAELVGAWGLGITWSDGHTTGIYSWGVLRAWAGLDRGP